MKRRTRNTWIALVLCAAMLLSLPMGVFAANGIGTEDGTEPPGGYYIQNDGFHYLDVDPLTLTRDIGEGIFYLEETDPALVVLSEGVETDGILSQLASDDATEATGMELAYTSAAISGSGVLLGVGSAELTLKADAATEVTVTVESLDAEGAAQPVAAGTAQVRRGTAKASVSLVRAYDDGQGEQPAYAAFRFRAGGHIRVRVTAEQEITVVQGAGSTVTLPFLYESENGYNGRATLDGESFNATLYWLENGLYLYDHDNGTWRRSVPADSPYTVNSDGDAVFDAFTFHALATLKNGAVQEGYTAEGSSLYPFPSYRKLYVDSVPLQPVKDLLYLPVTRSLYQDVFLPTAGVEAADADALPVLVYVHGFGGSYSDPRQSLAVASLKEGYAVVGIDLRNYPPEFSPSYYQDINGNIRYLRAHATEYGLDPERIGIYGVSLGGNSSLMGAVANDNDYTEGTVGGNTEVSSRVQAVVAGYAWSDALNFGLDQRTDNANDPELLGGMISGGDGENAPCAQAIDFYGPGKGYLVLRLYLADRQAAEEAGELEGFLSEPWTLTIDDAYIETWFPNESENAFTASSATCTKGTYTYGHEELMEKVAYAHAASPLYHITPDDPAIMVFGGYGGRQNITNTQSTRTLKRSYEMGVPAVMAGNTLGNYGGEEEVVAAMSEFLDGTLKHRPEGIRAALTLGRENAVVNDLDVAWPEALTEDEDGALQIDTAFLNNYFDTDLKGDTVEVEGLSIRGVTIKVYTYEIYVSNTETETRTTVTLTKSATAAAGTAPSPVVEPDYVSIPGSYDGYDSEETYASTVTKSIYVEVPAVYPDEVEFPSDPDYENDPSYDPENGTIRLAVTYMLPSEDGETVADGQFPAVLEISRGGRAVGASQFNAEYLVTHGYVWAMIEMRGCGASFGVNNSFSSLENRLDVNYLIEHWVTQQEWSDGHVAMEGGSNRGLIQWATATTAPEGLVAISPIVCNPDFYYQDYRNGASCVPGGGARLSGTGGDVTPKDYAEWVEAPNVVFVDDDPDGKLAYQAYAYYTTRNMNFTRYLLQENLLRDEPHEDLYGEQVNLTIPAVEYSDEIKASGIQIHQMAGWYDSNATFQIAAANAWGGKVVIGPWGHSATIRGTENDRPESGMDINVEQLRWFDSVLKGKDNGYEQSPKYYYYVLNAVPGEEWRYSDSFPLENSVDSVLYLAGSDSGEVIPDALALDGAQSNNGKLSFVLPADGSTDYRVDTSIQPEGFSNLDLSQTGEMQEAVDAKGLTFTSAPLSAAAEIVGIPNVDLWISSAETDDADFIVYLEEVFADGTSKMITQGAARASHRTTGPNDLWDSTEGMAGLYHTSLTADVEAALAEGLAEPVELKFNLEAVGYRVSGGSSLRVTVTCANTSVYQHAPYYATDADGNYIVGEDGKYVLKEGDELPVITLWQGGDHASLVHIPVVDNVSNTFNGTVAMDDGSYTGPGTLYLFEENWYLYANGSWTRLSVADGGNEYSVNAAGAAEFAAGFTFLPEGSRVVKNGIAQQYQGGQAHVQPFPSMFRLHVDTVYNQVGNTNANMLLYLPASKSLDINLFLPAGASASDPVPVIIYIHGFGGTNADLDTNLLEMLDKGYALAGVDLRNYPPNENPLYYQDVKGDIRYLRAHAGDLGLDPDRFGIYGSSLGGNTSLMMLLSGDDEFLEGTVGGNEGVSSRVQAGICGYAWSDALYFGLDQRNDNDNDFELMKSMISGGDGENAPCAQAIDFAGPGKGYLVLRNYLSARSAAEAAGTLEEFLSEDYSFTIDADYVDQWFPGQEGSTNAFIGSGATVTLGTYTYGHDYLMQKVADAEKASPMYYASEDDPVIVVYGGFGGRQNITNQQSVRTETALQDAGVKAFYFGNSVVGWNNYGRYGDPEAVQAGFQTYWEHYLMNAAPAAESTGGETPAPAGEEAGEPAEAEPGPEPTTEPEPSTPVEGGETETSAEAEATAPAPEDTNEEETSVNIALWLCIAAIVISIFVGWRFKLNTGIIAMAFAFIIGICVMGMRATAIINYWPTTIVFYLLSIALFFNYATENGTMNVLGQKLLYAMGGNAKMVPFAIALVSAIVGGLGAGASTPAIVGPFAFVMAATAGVNPVLTAVAISFGNLVGSNNPYNGYGGTISKNLIIANEVDEALAMNWSLKIWVNCALITIIVIVLFYLFLRGHRATNVALNEKPPEFDPIQKKTVTVLLIAFVLMVVPPILNTWIKGVAFLSTLNQICQPQVIMMLGALVCAVLRLGDEKTVIRKIPISTIVMIVGVYSLIQVAAAAGLVDAISAALANSIPRNMVPAAIVLFAAFLSFFSSSTSTVMPLMYPMVPTLAAGLGLNPVMLYTCIFFGGLATSCSPFSTGGAVCIAANPYEDQKEALSNKMIVCALIIPIITIIAASLGLFSIFPA